MTKFWSPFPILLNIKNFFEENKNSRRLQEKCGFLFHHEEEVKTLWGETKKEIVMFMDYERYTDLYL